MTSTSRRSDLVREKRKQRKRSTTPKRKTSRREMPAAVSRSGMVYTPRQPRKSTAKRNTRKRYNVALNAPGAELRLPAVPAVQVGWRLISGALVVLLSFAIYAMWTAPQFIVKTVTVEGLDRINQAEMINRLGILDQPIFLVDSAQLEEDILARFSALDDIQVKISYPAEVTILAGERLPVVAWEQTGYANWWIDQDGMAFEPLGSSENLVHVEAMAAPPSLTAALDQGDLELSGLEEQQPAQQLLTPAMVDAILFLDQLAPEGVELIFDEEHGLGWVDPEFGWQVYFGSKLDQMDARWAIYRAIVEDLQSKNRKPWLISVEFVHAPYYRLKR